MEKELEGLQELTQVRKEGNGEFLAVNIEEDMKEEKHAPAEKGNASVTDSLLEIEPNVLRRRRLTEDAGSTSITTELVDSINKNLSLYSSRDSSPVSIYSVPKNLRKVNKEAYTPRSISIGPIHHGKPELQAMQRYKWRFLHRYVLESSMSLNKLVQTARDMETEVRDCYQERFDYLSSKEFSEMIMLDGTFLTMFLQADIRNKDNKTHSGLLGSSSYQLYLNQWVKSDIIHDLMLLENQLPFLVLENFHKYMGDGCGLSQLTVEESIFRFFLEVGNMRTLEIRTKPSEVRHLVDFLRNYWEPKYVRSRGKIVYNRSATELQEAGVKFEPGLNCDMFEIKFLKGTLELPPLRIDEYTETLFRNMIAFEQCQYDEEKDITSYIIFMDSLIDTAKDVDLLVDCGIIEIKNFPGDHERIATLFNNLHKETATREGNFCFEKLCTELNEYSKDYWHQWKAKWFRSKKALRREYFNTPWSTLSVIAALILLFLTTIQTICSIISLL